MRSSLCFLEFCQRCGFVIYKTPEAARIAVQVHPQVQIEKCATLFHLVSLLCVLLCLGFLGHLLSKQSSGVDCSQIV